MLVLQHEMKWISVRETYKLAEEEDRNVWWEHQNEGVQTKMTEYHYVKPCK